jgi:hypothetical protein
MLGILGMNALLTFDYITSYEFSQIAFSISRLVVPARFNFGSPNNELRNTPAFIDRKMRQRSDIRSCPFEFKA